MEQVISEHIDNFRNFVLIFDVELIFRKVQGKIYLNEMLVFDKMRKIARYVEITQSILMNGEREGIAINMVRNGRKLSQGLYHRGKEEGLWVYWYYDGQKRKEGSFHNGLKDGLWFESGRIALEGNFHNGKKEGQWTSWNKDETKYSQGNYRNDEKVGIWRFWRKTGQLLTKDYGS